MRWHAILILLIVVIQSSLSTRKLRSNEANAFTKPNLDVLKLVVTNVSLVHGDTHKGTLDTCANKGWLPIGVNWVDEKLFSKTKAPQHSRARQAEPSSSSPLPSSYRVQPFTFLCILQQFDHNISPDALVVRSIMVYPQNFSCPSEMMMMLTPRPNVTICVEFIKAAVAFESKRYVSDVMTTTEEYYNNEQPGWITLPTSVHIEPYFMIEKQDWTTVRGSGSWSVGSGSEDIADVVNNTTTPVNEEESHLYVGPPTTELRPVFLSIRQPIRPIVNVQFLSHVTVSESYTACDKLTPEKTWESPGFGYIDVYSGSQDNDTKENKASRNRYHGILCVQRSHIINDSRDVLLEIVASRSSEECPTFFTNSTRISLTLDPKGAITVPSLCLQWGNSDQHTNGSFIADIALHRTRKSRPQVDMLPGQWSFLLVDFNAAIHNTHTYLFFRMTGYESTKKEYESNEIESTVSRRPPLLATLTRPTDPMALPSLSFRIVQIADLHYTGQPDYPCREPPPQPQTDIYEVFGFQSKHILSGGTCHEAWLTEFIENVLDIEQPEMVVFTGDNIHVDDVWDRVSAMQIYSQAVEARGIPWAMIFGNHDETGRFSKEEMMKMVQGQRFSYVASGPKSVDGVGNYELNVAAPVTGVWGSRGDTVFRMYFLDSHADIDADSTMNNGLLYKTRGYEWIKPSQINYYKAMSQSHMRDRVPAIMFFHIPLPEYQLASSAQRHGKKYENIGSAAVNSGLFSTLVEMNEVKATFCGHDHLNDYCYLRQGIQLCYGGVAGMGRAYAAWQLDRRVRVIEWQYDGSTKQRTLTTWKRFFQDPTQRQQQEVLYAE